MKVRNKKLNCEKTLSMAFTLRLALTLHFSGLTYSFDNTTYKTEYCRWYWFCHSVPFKTKPWQSFQAKTLSQSITQKSPHLSRIFSKDAVKRVNFWWFIGRWVRFLNRHCSAVLFAADDVFSFICFYWSNPNNNANILYFIFRLFFLEKDNIESMRKSTKQKIIVQKIEIFREGWKIEEFKQIEKDFPTTYRHYTELLHFVEYLIKLLHCFQRN